MDEWQNGETKSGRNLARVALFGLAALGFTLVDEIRAQGMAGAEASTSTAATATATPTATAAATATAQAAKVAKLLGTSFAEIRLRNYGNAEKLLLSAQEIDPGNPYIWLNLGVVYHRTHRFELAREFWKKVAESPPVGVASAVITSNSSLLGATPADVARQNLLLLDQERSAARNQ